ncbi:MAG: DUF2867 domain-containing protein [Roseivirga sp.]|nr:DUF2867 domain-containing protein [Roseivirga sp.]
MSKVKEEPVFLTEASKRLFSRIDFADTFATTNRSSSLQELGNAIFDRPPKWVKGLFKVRNRIVRYFGLKTTMPEDYHTEFEEGGYISFFKILHVLEDELVLGANDNHLDFRAIISKTQEPEFNIKVTTLVRFNNKTGRIYMALIAPFHRLVVKRMISQAWQPAS